jgi:hypothetical protein
VSSRFFGPKLLTNDVSGIGALQITDLLRGWGIVTRIGDRGPVNNKKE